MTTSELTDYYCHYATRFDWQQQLRRSVRLHLALSEPGLSTQAVLAALHLVEFDLCQLLLASNPASAAMTEAADTATFVVHQHQTALLQQPAACEALRRAMPVTEFEPALHATCGQRSASQGAGFW